MLKLTFPAALGNEGPTNSSSSLSSSDFGSTIMESVATLQNLKGKPFEYYIRSTQTNYITNHTVWKNLLILDMVRRVIF